MTDYAAVSVASSQGTAVTERSGTASADTVPAGSLVLWRNTGIGAHTVTLTTNNTVGDLAVADRTIALAAGQVKAGQVPKDWGDVNKRVQVAIDGTASEVKYYVLDGN
ncbi:hypothetical protein O7634_24565 [Micromonospora sp. WMMD1120]|uniref:hypothetical protein n=1 Tax=Micromonospora sp. WMMD1120 TaxID=3016106 RepID=UPI00241601A0|nr:hypothetical protein [Micromonospora sp. WMMD1120]MDG4809937.1 hypothetical protein [Micromonospora sp. WMMD1120]